MGRPFACALLALSCLLPGCVPLFYAYPSISCTLPAKVGPNHLQTYAFRVDCSDESGSACVTGARRYSFCELHITPEGDITAQPKIDLDYGLLWVGPQTHRKHVCKSVRLRLYRPGFELVEFKSWQFGQAIEWKAAADPEKVVDALLATTREENPSQGDPFAHLEFGSVSREHRQVLLFGADEYARLSRAATLEPGRRDGLLAKSKVLRDLADH